MCVTLKSRILHMYLLIDECVALTKTLSPYHTILTYHTIPCSKQCVCGCDANCDMSRAGWALLVPYTNGVKPEKFYLASVQVTVHIVRTALKKQHLEIHAA